MTFALAFPAIDPVLIHIGPIPIRWYALAYIVGLLAGWLLMRRLAEGPPRIAAERDVDDFLVWATLGVVLGGRIGYVLFYQFAWFVEHPAYLLRIWQGGMSFHGGFLGVVVAGWLFVRKRRLPLGQFADIVACVAPIGLFFGRVANFINGELFGRAADVPWAVVFPRGGDIPRHPSQLYEAALEGLLLFGVMLLMWRVPAIRRRPGVLTGMFLAGYGAARCIGEFYREPDSFLGFFAGGTTMGQWLSLPMVGVGAYLILRNRRR